MRSSCARAARRSTPPPAERSLIGHSAAFVQLRAQAEKLARNQAPVFIHGESGTGKEVIARYIHGLGARAAGPFVPVNCGAISPELMESEFFGHRKGSFTGAGTDKEGLFQAANGGTLFLDEIGELPLAMQVKLLRAIQERAVRPVGAHAEEPVDVRILSASHQDLGRLVAEGRFRQDLFFRINVITLRVPPLRERREDIPELATHILARLAAREGGRRAACRRMPCRRCSATPSRATCASWRTCSSAPARCARAARSAPPTSSSIPSRAHRAGSRMLRRERSARMTRPRTTAVSSQRQAAMPTTTPNVCASSARSSRRAGTAPPPRVTSA